MDEQITNLKRGTIVTVKGVVSNGHDEQPAIVTYAGELNEGRATVNVKVFPDLDESIDLTSVPFFTDPEKLATYIQENPLTPVTFIE